ncbi:MAG: hypothetical protein PUF74_08535 [Sodaliphilus pleomorphus]|uniref:hypothetical protein n=1 Tax=Sodaliphilus pleomorphus TaxID=2606626 RepID=UPI002409B1E4|nr:hypothetical protein [Sodaliphilus pleomorphus]MDD6475550.1 hypothetical protein [Sodaliphilus pleomorphus]
MEVLLDGVHQLVLHHAAQPPQVGLVVYGGGHAPRLYAHTRRYLCQVLRQFFLVGSSVPVYLLAPGHHAAALARVTVKGGILISFCTLNACLFRISCYLS